MATIQEYDRFVAGIPEAEREYRTLELYHPSLNKVYRFVRNSIDVSFNLESSAPRNAGELVAFSRATMSITEPSEREDSEQILSVSFGNVGGIMHEILDQISGYGLFQQMEVVYRKYFSGVTTEPAATPLYLFASTLGFTGESVTFVAEDANLSQKRSGRQYTIETFPGLAP